MHRRRAPGAPSDWISRLYARYAAALRVIHRQGEVFPTVDNPVDKRSDAPSRPGSGQPGHRSGAAAGAVRGGCCGDGSGRGPPGGSARRHFHCVETPKPAAMKPKPARMFQLPQLPIGQSPLVT
ncbi:hypothetical protein GCM10009759_75590 [Kitasatospora saccharophila]|uniref:Uncharacterized protein n=1 Tax=Kitasatospora saccharophila TaxID=407973 RepID=A0ABN2YD24_9ACTN